MERWLPEIVQRRPRRLVMRYRSGGMVCSESLLNQRIDDAITATSLTWRRTGDGTWLMTLPWQTRVLGVLQRRVTEQVEVRLTSGRGGQEVSACCRPDRTHDAHAAGMSCVIVLAFIAWLAGGSYILLVMCYELGYGLSGLSSCACVLRACHEILCPGILCPGPGTLFSANVL